MRLILHMISAAEVSRNTSNIMYKTSQLVDKKQYYSPG